METRTRRARTVSEATPPLSCSVRPSLFSLSLCRTIALLSPRSSLGFLHIVSLRPLSFYAFSLPPSLSLCSSLCFLQIVSLSLSLWRVRAVWVCRAPAPCRAACLRGACSACGRVLPCRQRQTAHVRVVAFIVAHKRRRRRHRLAHRHRYADRRHRGQDTTGKQKKRWPKRASEPLLRFSSLVFFLASSYSLSLSLSVLLLLLRRRRRRLCFFFFLASICAPLHRTNATIPKSLPPSRTFPASFLFTPVFDPFSTHFRPIFDPFSTVFVPHDGGRATVARAGALQWRGRDGAASPLSLPLSLVPTHEQPRTHAHVHAHAGDEGAR